MQTGFWGMKLKKENLSVAWQLTAHMPLCEKKKRNSELSEIFLDKTRDSAQNIT